MTERTSAVQNFLEMYVPSHSRPWSLQCSERKLLLGVLDLLAVNTALAVVLWLRLGQPLSYRVLLQHPLWFLLLSALWLLVDVAFDTRELKAASTLSASLRRVVPAGVCAALLYVAIPFLTPPLLGSRLTLGLFPVLMLGLLSVERSAYALVLAQPAFQRRTLIVGAGWAGRTIAQVLAEHGHGAYQIVGFVDDDPAKRDLTLHISPFTLRVLGTRHAIPDLIARHRVTTLILAITHEVNGDLLQVLMDSLELGIEIVPMPILYEQLTGRVPIEHVGDNWYVAMPIRHPGNNMVWPVVKRIMDIVLSTAGLMVLGLATPLIALAIYLDSPGPIFYTQERVGKGGRRFRVYKFRSMVPNAEKGKAVWAKKNDCRVTRVGRLLRKTHVDEFPQFLNILKGEMSAVGPRPERPEFVDELARDIPFYRVRHAVKPGMAGWGLVKQGYGASKEDALLKLQYDLYYIKYQSLWLDVVILIKTIVDTLTFRGRA